MIYKNVTKLQERQANKLFDKFAQTTGINSMSRDFDSFSGYCLYKYAILNNKWYSCLINRKGKIVKSSNTENCTLT